MRSFCRSNFSFQHGASHRRSWLKLRTTLAMVPFAITDECSLAGVARAFTSWRDACEKRGHSIESSPLRLIVGACFRCDDSEIILLAKTSSGYEHLCQLDQTRCRIDTDKAPIPSIRASCQQSGNAVQSSFPVHPQRWAKHWNTEDQPATVTRHWLRARQIDRNRSLRFEHALSAKASPRL